MFDISALYKLLKRDLDVYRDVRNTLDILFLVVKSPRATLKEVLDISPEIKLSSIEACEKKASDYLSIGLCDETQEAVLFSKVLKRHFSSAAFRKKMMDNQEIDMSSLSNKREQKDLCVKRVHSNILSGPYAGLLPTRKYKECGEVYIVTESFINELAELYPSHNITSELCCIFDYLVRVPIARKPSTGMKHFIKKWISGDLLTSARQINRQKKISVDTFYTDLRQNGI